MANTNEKSISSENSMPFNNEITDNSTDGVRDDGEDFDINTGSSGDSNSEDDIDEAPNVDVYSENPIFKTTDVARLVDDDISADMIRYYARMFKDFLPDAIHVTSGSPRFSQRDIDVLKRVLQLKKGSGYSKEKIMKILSDKSNELLTTPSIMTHENFMQLFTSEGFTDFMDYYTANVIKKVAQEDNKKLDVFLERVNLLLSEVDRAPLPSHQEDNNKALIAAQNEITMRDQEIAKLKEQLQSGQEGLEKKIEELQEQLDDVRQNKSKGFLAKLFSK